MIPIQTQMYNTSIYIQNECKKCAENEYALPNSIGKESCKVKKPCTADDYTSTKSECINDKITITYNWDNTSTLYCINEGVALPSPKEETCQCTPGYYKDSIGVCSTCPTEYYSNENSLKETPEKCIECGGGFYAPKLNKLNSFTPSCFNENKCSSPNSEVCNLFSGWKTNSEGVYPGSNIPDDIEFILTKEINILQDEGFVGIEYTILKEFATEEFFFITLDGIRRGINCI